MVQNGLPYLSIKKIQVDSKSKDMEYSTIFSENIFNLTYAPFSKYQGPTIRPTTPTNPSNQQTNPTTPPITFNHEGSVPKKSSVK